MRTLALIGLVAFAAACGSNTQRSCSDMHTPCTAGDSFVCNENRQQNWICTCRQTGPTSNYWDCCLQTVGDMCLILD
jgi:hypothetical protein